MTDAHIYVIGILLAWMAGIRAYLTVFGVGLAGLLGWVDLPPAPASPWPAMGSSPVPAPCSTPRPNRPATGSPPPPRTGW